MYSGVISVKSLSVISLFSSLSSKSMANGSILSSPLLHIACVKYLYKPQCSHVLQFLEEMWDAMFVCRKRICYHVSVTWIMVTQPFILHSQKKTILVVKIIVIFRIPLITIFKLLLKMPNLSCLVIFCLLQVISLLYTIVFRGIFFFLFLLSTKV